MKLSQYIEVLQTLHGMHGDIEVDSTFFDGERIPAYTPVLAYKKILSGRERKPKFWAVYDHIDVQGEQVIRV